jgi:hypothetical protein
MHVRLRVRALAVCCEQVGYMKVTEFNAIVTDKVKEVRAQATAIVAIPIAAATAKRHTSRPPAHSVRVSAHSLRVCFPFFAVQTAE